MNKRLLLFGWLMLGVLSASLALSADLTAIELPLTGTAYYLADDAYKAYERGDYRRAARKAREAIRLRPDVARLKDVLNKSQAALRPPASVAPRKVRVAREPSQPLVPQSPPNPAYAAADAAYKAYDRRDYAQAINYAQDAVRQSPANGSYWLMLVNALMAAGRYEDADQAVSDGLAQAGESQALLAQRTVIHRELAAVRTTGDMGFEIANQAYKAFEAKRYDDAIAAIREALRIAPNAPNNRNYRLLLVNAALLANRLEEAEEAASAVLATRLATSGEDAALLAQRGYIRQRLGQHALAKEDFAAALRIGGLPLTLEVGLLADSGRKQDARYKFIGGLDTGAFNKVTDLEFAYLATRVGEDDKALAAFNRADSAGKLPDTALADAAFSAVRSGRDGEAVGYFRRTIDAADPLAMEPQLLINTRRAVATVSREFGVVASLSHRGAGSTASPGSAPGASGSGGLQAGMEAYWRPFGYQNGRTVEVFGRVFQTLQDKAGGAVGGPTAQGTIGARWKPLTDHNLVLSFGRLIPIGSQATGDWLAQAAYSSGHGADLRVDLPDWWTAQWFGEVGRYFQHPQTYGIASVQAGRSFRLDALSPKLVVFPHLTMNAEYNSLNNTRSAVGVGPGVNLRYWFRGDFYTAPMSFIDLSLQYRLKLGGDDRARGFFMTTTLAF